jgi:hypothetical protein
MLNLLISMLGMYIAIRCFNNGVTFWGWANIVASATNFAAWAA